MKSETAVRRALKRWENREPRKEYECGWMDCLAWVLEFASDPTNKKQTREPHP